VRHGLDDLNPNRIVFHHVNGNNKTDTASMRREYAKSALVIALSIIVVSGTSI
jgi:hypothetical protein